MNANQEIILTNRSIIQGINPRTKELLFISAKNPSNINFGLTYSLKIDFITGDVKLDNDDIDDPSTIFIHLPIIEPKEYSEVSNPSYYPSYASLSPEQKWIYLSWLRDLSNPIQIGYVFIYYYGLERQLLKNNFDLAFDEILLLRDHHNNGSFMYYSNKALLTSCILNNRIDRINEIYDSSSIDRIDNIELLVAYKSNSSVSAENLVKIIWGVKGVQKKYVSANYNLFISTLKEIMCQKYGLDSFPINEVYKLEDLPKENEIIFANYSFPNELRNPLIPNFFKYDKFQNDIKELFLETTQIVRKKLKEIAHNQQINRMP